MRLIYWGLVCGLLLGARTASADVTQQFLGEWESFVQVPVPRSVGRGTMNATQRITIAAARSYRCVTMGPMGQQGLVGRLQTQGDQWTLVVGQEKTQSSSYHFQRNIAVTLNDGNERVVGFWRHLWAPMMRPRVRSVPGGCGHATTARKKPTRVAPAAGKGSSNSKFQRAEELASHAFVLLANEPPQPKKAEALLRQAIQLYPKKAEYYFNLGGAVSAQGRNGEAEKYFRQAVKLAPGDDMILSRLSRCLSTEKKYADAEAVCRQLVHLKPRNAEYHNDLGVALCDQGKIEEGLVELRKAAKLDPGNRVYKQEIQAAEEAQDTPFG